MVDDINQALINSANFCLQAETGDLLHIFWPASKNGVTSIPSFFDTKHRMVSILILRASKGSVNGSIFPGFWTKFSGFLVCIISFHYVDFHVT